MAIHGENSCFTHKTTSSVPSCKFTLNLSVLFDRQVIPKKMFLRRVSEKQQEGKRKIGRWRKGKIVKVHINIVKKFTNAIG